MNAIAIYDLLPIKKTGIPRRPATSVGAAEVKSSATEFHVGEFTVNDALSVTVPLPVLSISKAVMNGVAVNVAEFRRFPETATGLGEELSRIPPPAINQSALLLSVLLIVHGDATPLLLT
jgi:hypothetical protein